MDRTYSDVAQTLSHYSSLSPRTDVYSMMAASLIIHTHLVCLRVWLTLTLYSIRIRSLLSTSSPQWYLTRHIPGHYLQVSSGAMDTTCLSEGCANMLCEADGGHGDQAGPTCQWGRKGVSSLLGRLVNWERESKCEWTIPRTLGVENCMGKILEWACGKEEVLLRTNTESQGS